MSEGGAITPIVESGRRSLDIARLHALFPWPENLLKHGKPLEWIWSLTVHAAPSEIWPLISDTSRLNRTLGLPLMKYEELGGMLHGSTKYWGVPAQWIEPPWSWEVNRYLYCEREYSRGFARVFRAVCFLEPIDERTTVVHMYFAWIPRGFFWRIFLKRMFPKMEPVYLRALGRLDRHLADPARTAFHRAPKIETTDQARTRLAEGREKMIALGVKPELADRWVEYLGKGDPMDLHRIHLRIVAREWKFEERQVLESALIGVEAGLLQLHWDIVCPHCRGPRASLDSLAQLPPGLRCDACRVDFLTEGKGHIDVTFRPHPSLRKTEPLFYCAAEPARKEHYLAQRRLRSGESCAIGLNWGRGEYLASVNGQERGTITIIGNGTNSATPKTWRASESLGELTASSAGSLQAINDSGETAIFTLRQRDFHDDMAQLGDLLTIPAFSRLFGSETLPLNAPLDLGDQSLVFVATEDSGGASNAPFLKRAKQIAESRNGILIRTASQSTILLFNRPADAVQAAEELLKTSHESGAPRFRLSVHIGDCLVVRVSSGLDLIGRTVSVASRLASDASWGEAILSSSVFADTEAAHWLRSQAYELRIAQMDYDDLGVVEQARRWKLPHGNAGGSA